MTNDNRDVTLDIIGREHQALMATGQQLHFTMIAELVLSILTFAYCVGWVTISPQLVFGGLTISTSQPHLLLVLAAVITGLSWRVANLSLYGVRVRKTIVARYDALGFTGHTDDTRFIAFAYPDLVTVMDASQANLAAYFKRIFQQRPIRRGIRPQLILLSWLITLVVAFAVLLVIFLGPFALDVYAGVFALQHHMNPIVVGAVVLVLCLVNIASVWTSMQTAERKELVSPAILEAVDELTEYAKYEAAQKAAKDTESAAKRESGGRLSDAPSSGVMDADTNTHSGGGGETDAVA